MGVHGWEPESVVVGIALWFARLHFGEPNHRCRI